MRRIPNLTFLETETESLILDLYLPEATANPPLVIFIHGGGWTLRLHDQVPVLFLVNQGYALASITYRLSFDAQYPAQLHDVQAAIRWLRANAHRWSLNADRLVLVGSSAGGYLATLAGVTATREEYDGRLGNHIDQSLEVAGVVAYFAPSDFLLRARTQPRSANDPRSTTYQLLGTSPERHPELARRASPAWQVSNAAPPLLLFHGSSDSIVLPDQSKRLAEAYQSVGRPVQLHLVPGADHYVSDFYDRKSLGILTEFLDQIVRRTP